MKQISTLLIIVIIFTGFQIKSKVEERTDFKEFLEERYQTGEEGFLQDLYSRIIYPERSKYYGKTGKLKVRMQIDQIGQIIEIKYLNKLDEELEEELERVLKETEGNWRMSNKLSYFEFETAFKFQQNASEFEGDINIIGQTEKMIDTKDELENKLKDSLIREDKKGSIKYLEELLMRYPDNLKYRKKYENLKNN